MIFGLSLANCGKLHHLPRPQPPPRLAVGHQRLKEREAIFALQERPQLVHGIGTSAPDAMLRNPLIEIEHVCQNPPRFAGFQRFEHCGKGPARVQSDTQNGEIDTRFGTPQICVSAGDRRR